ncbi:MAG: NHLP leader peptide family RiPP precursor [Treponema sp.]|nr:NHLP leader peptide family RiPP precursor [Treponema sp.]
MEEWTQKEMETLYQQIQVKASHDAEFRKNLLTDANKTIEKLAGKALPDGCAIKVIEQDPNYASTLVIPDLVSDELDENALDKAAGGISFVLVVSACAAAFAVGPCPADACAGKLGFK